MKKCEMKNKSDRYIHKYDNCFSHPSYYCFGFTFHHLIILFVTNTSSSPTLYHQGTPTNEFQCYNHLNIFTIIKIAIVLLFAIVSGVSLSWSCLYFWVLYKIFMALILYLLYAIVSGYYLCMKILFPQFRTVRILLQSKLYLHCGLNTKKNIYKETECCGKY